MELIPPFEIAQHDMFLELTIPTTLVRTTLSPLKTYSDTPHNISSLAVNVNSTSSAT